MIIVKMSGGLGNQIAQYALLRKLQTLYPETKVKMDLSFYKQNHVHNGFELEKLFGISERDVRAAKLFELFKVRYEIPTEAFGKFSSIFIKPVAWLNARSRKFFSNIGLRNEIREAIHGTAGAGKLLQMIHNMDISRNWYIDGYWMDEIFWKEILQEIIDELVFPDFHDEQNLNWEKQIKEDNSVSIHVRRGDYVGSKFDILSMDYYRKAVQYIEKTVKNVTYYIFTDDKEYVEREFEFLENKHYIQNNYGSNSWCDMKLMSLCKHNILANSTFSNWAGYFNRNKDKIIIYPSKYSEAGMNTDKQGKGWIKLAVE